MIIADVDNVMCGYAQSSKHPARRRRWLRVFTTTSITQLCVDSFLCRWSLVLTIMHHQTLATLFADAGISLTTLAGLDPARRNLNEAARSTIYIVLTCGAVLCSLPNEVASYAAPWRNSGAAGMSRGAAAAWDVSLQ